MKFDTIIIGGGLSGLISGITAAKQGKRVAIISTGQSALHFSSGSFELLSGAKNPLQAMASLPASHPYARIGAQRASELANEVPQLLAEAGIAVSGSAESNHLNITPLGKIKNGWLTLNDFLTFETMTDLKGQKAEIINVKGYLDFYPEYIALALRKLEVSAKAQTMTIAELERLRKNSTEMRASNIARALEGGDALEHFATELNRIVSPTTDFVLMPAVVGLTSEKPLEMLRSRLKCPIYFIPTMPSSVPGVRTQLQLVKYFEKLGGKFILGDTVTDGVIEEGKLKVISTANLGDNVLTADNFILATGSFFSKGLKSNFEKVYEPIFDLKVDYLEHRSEWYNEDSYAPQPYMKFGVAVDEEFHPIYEGASVENMYAVGSVVGGCNPLADGCGAGVAILTAMHVAQKLS